jgi:hypothetical protein
MVVWSIEGAGFIGSHPADRLLADGADVVALDNSGAFYPCARKCANLGYALRSPRAWLIERARRDPPAAARSPGSDRLPTYASNSPRSAARRPTYPDQCVGPSRKTTRRPSEARLPRR